MKWYVPLHCNLPKHFIFCLTVKSVQTYLEYLELLGEPIEITPCHDIAELLLKLALNINQSINHEITEEIFNIHRNPN
jgi:hypothetical protein